MDTKEIKPLFRKYLEDQLSPEEIKRLKMLLNEMDESTFADHLYPLWESFQPPASRNLQAFDKISRDLKSTLQPARKSPLIHLILRCAAAACLLILLASTYHFYKENKTMQASYDKPYTVSTEKGERALVTLPDGTKVFLNVHSRLSYSTWNDKKQRSVQLEGEAYFEVKHNATAPFIVHTSEADIQVLGTTFNVYAYPAEKWFETTLVSGQVRVTLHKSADNPVLLSKNQKLRYNNQTGEYDTRHTDLRLETAWRKGDLIFRSENIAFVLRQIAEFYGINFFVEGTYPEKLFTGNYHEEDVNVVLQNLQQHYVFTYQKKGDDIHIKFK